MSAVAQRSPAEEIKYWLTYIDCALNHPHPLPAGKHVYRTALETVPDIRELYHCLFKLYTEEASSVNFREPVNALQLRVFGYYDVVKTPMSLRTVLDNIADGAYYSRTDQVMRDVELIWQNAEAFNGAASPVTAEARKCAAALERIRKAYRDEQLVSEEDSRHIVDIISSDDEEMLSALFEYFRREDPSMVDGDGLDVTRLKMKHLAAMQSIVDRFMSKKH